jgi:adhesin/invasin
MRTGIRRFASTASLPALALLVFLTVGCDKVPLTAPTNSTVRLSASALVLPMGGSTTITATVIEQAGTPVQNGTTVRFTTTLGRVDPAEVQTRDGIATATFFAGDVSGTADIRATSGGIGGAAGTGDNATSSNQVAIAVGAAAVDTIIVRSSAGSVPATGGMVTIAATVNGAGGRPLAGIPVSFSTTAGTLSQSRVTTDAEGDAETRLTTDANATVTASAGTKTGTVAIQALNPVPTPTISLASSASDATSVGQLFTFTATITDNAALGTPVKFEWDFGDGTTAETNGPAIGHVYSKELNVYNVTVRAVFSNGSAVSTLTQIVTADFP